MQTEFTEKDWQLLVNRVDTGRITPFLGAGAAYGVLPLGAEVAKELSKRYGYPFPENEDLVRVATYGAINYDASYPKEVVLKILAERQLPHPKDPNDPHAALAELPLSVYLTTNYDGLMVRALKARHRAPRRELCRWNPALQREPSVFDGNPPHVLDPANPVVFHLHGHDGSPDSLVLTEDDYLQFLLTMTRDPTLLPGPIKTALENTSLVFIGYRLGDWNLRVLLRGLNASTRYRGVVVLPPPGGDDEVKRRLQQDYLTQYFGEQELRVYWGTAAAFCRELRDRWFAANPVHPTVASRDAG